MNQSLQPMDIGDIFEKTFSLTGSTFVRNLVIALLFLILPVVFLSFSANDFYSSLTDLSQLQQHGSELDGDFYSSFFWSAAFFVLFSLLYGLGMLFAEIAITITVAKEFLDDSISFGSAIGETFNGTWLTVIGQLLLKACVGIGCGIVAAIIVGIVTFSGGSDSIFIAILGLILIPVMIYLFVRWTFTQTAVIVDNNGVVDSFRQSWMLTDGHWWRTVGIFLLFTLMIQFAINIIEIPLTFGSMWDVYKELFTSLQSSQGNISTEELQNLQKSLGYGIGISAGISGVLNLLVSPVFMVVMYFDLKARREKFEQEISHTEFIKPQPEEK
jgi:hypothetical protein